jgi:hypothetical protein
MDAAARRAWRRRFGALGFDQPGERAGLRALGVKEQQRHALSLRGVLQPFRADLQQSAGIRPDLGTPLLAAGAHAHRGVSPLCARPGAGHRSIAIACADRPGYPLGEAPDFPLGRSTADAIVNYLNIQLDPADMLSIRNEFVDDHDGQRTGFATRYSSHTVGMTHWVSQDLEIRPELRYERAYDFPAYDGGRKNHQAVALIDAILHY